MAVTPVEQLGKDALRKKGWFGAYKWLILRRLTQVGILVLFMVGPIGGVWVLKGNLAGSWLFETIPMVEPSVFLQMLAAGMFGFLTTTVVGVAVVVAFYALIGGRAYCSWVCPVNIITDTAAWARRKLGITQSAKISPQTRWWMLGGVLLLAALTGQLAYELVNPVSIIHRELIFGMSFAEPELGMPVASTNGSGLVFDIGAGVGLVAAGIFLFDLLIAKHGWCSHVCPMGALYTLIGAPAQVKVATPNRASCDDCMECFEVCPEPQILPAALKQGMRQGLPAMVTSSLCTRCGRCVDICSKEVFTFNLLTIGKARKVESMKTSGRARERELKKAS